MKTFTSPRGYGRPFPPRYKDILADRGSTAGELGFHGKRLNNLSVYYAPLVGANYDVHGIKYHPVPLLTNVDPEASGKNISKLQNETQDILTGITSLGYDTPGYGYSIKDKDGTPIMQKPYHKLQKNLTCLMLLTMLGVFLIGHDIRKTGADVVIYSMDKASGSSTSGLIIGKKK